MNKLIIRLNVVNHPGVLSKITGLFSRRLFNLEGIVCGEVKEGVSRMFLLVDNSDNIEQIIKQLNKLNDVYDVSLSEDSADEMLDSLRQYCSTM